ncbi:MAG: hypothetical protein AB1Z98_13345 [Nannocystaceae bacterium]
MAGCPGDDSSGDGTTEAATGTIDPGTTTDMTSVDSSGSETAADTGAVPTDCQEEREVPPSPFDCTGVDGVLEGSVIIDDTPESDDPSMLEGISVVTGSIQLNTTDLTNLDFMGCVTEVGGEINIFDNDMLTNVDGLHNVTSIGTQFVFSNNDGLVDFNSLPNIQQMATTLAFRGNGALEHISGFHSLVGITANVTDPDGNPAVTGSINIQQNPVLLDVDGLGGLRVVGGIFAINNNPMLCVSSPICVGEGITVPAIPPDEWSIANNDDSC